MKKNLINTFIKNNTINPKILIILNLISAILIITLISIHPFVGMIIYTKNGNRI